MALNLTDGPAQGFVDGVPFESEHIEIRNSGGGVRKKTFNGTFVSPTTPDSDMTIRAPFFGNANPVDVARVAAKIANTPMLFVITSKVSGSTDTFWGWVNNRTKTFDSAQGADQSWDVIITEPIEA